MMFNTIRNAYKRSQPFLNRAYQATESGLTSAGYAVKTATYITIAVAQTAKAVVKTGYYSFKHAIKLHLAAKHDAENDRDDAQNIDLEAGQGEKLKPTKYDEAYAAASADFRTTVDVLYDKVSPFASEAANSFGSCLMHGGHALGHGFAATGEGITLATDAANALVQYCLEQDIP